MERILMVRTTTPTEIEIEVEKKASSSENDTFHALVDNFSNPVDSIEKPRMKARPMKKAKGQHINLISNQDHSTDGGLTQEESNEDALEMAKTRIVDKYHASTRRIRNMYKNGQTWKDILETKGCNAVLNAMLAI
jgi:hypothetical protein